MPTNQEEFRQQVAKITGDDADFDYDGLDDPAVVAALEAFATALNPDRQRPRLRKPRKDGTIVDVEASWGTGTEYLTVLRLTHERGFALLDGTTDEYNDFMLDMVDGALPEYGGRIQRTTASKYQAAARAFYRFCDEPGKRDERPDTTIGWPAEDVIVFADQSEPRYDESDMFEQSEIDALREGCIRGRNPRRDRAVLEVLAGTCQRLEAVRTLLVGDVHVDPDDRPPYVLLNPEIKNNGDKGAIELAGRWRPIVSDAGPIREFIDNHPLADPDVRAEHGCPDRFEDCYLFVGDPDNHKTNASRPWDDGGIRDRLERIGNDVGVTKPVKPHNFRHWAYSKSKKLPLDESVRERIFSWRPGSGTGTKTYDHVEAEQAGRQFAEAWADAFGDDDGGSVPGVSEAIIGEIAAMDIPPETARAFVRAALSDEQARAELEALFVEAAD